MGNKRVLDIGYGINSLYHIYKSELLSSRALYGMIELSDNYGYNIEYISLSKHGLWGHIKNNLLLIKSADGIVLPYMFIQPLFLFAILRLFGFFKRRRLVVICHKTLINDNKWIRRLFYKMIYRSVDCFLFHSVKNLEESRDSIGRRQAKFMLWGENLAFIDKFFSVKDGGYFLSTGRENRDFNTLVNAFLCTDPLLKIYTNKNNYSESYEFLENVPQNRNIEVTFVNRSNSTTMTLAKKVAECFCVVIPINKNSINYCVGLTSIVEAMAFGKPIISTRNPYSPIDIEKEGIGLWVDTKEDWVNAVSFLWSNSSLAKNMGRRGRLLAEKYYNINETARILDSVL